MFLEKVLIFFLFLGPLVFFHELGHFLFARFFGVRVEVFSIGFGPKILKFKKGATEYALSLIPLGGYIKMFGDDPLKKDEIAEEDRKISFTHKGKWARFWIIMGGPLANFIIAYFIFATLFITGERVPELKIGVIPQESKFYKLGFRSGDAIRKVNDTAIFSPSDIMMDESSTIKTMTVKGIKGIRKVTLNMSGEDFFKDFVKYPATLRKPLVVNMDGKLFALSANAKSVNWNISIDEIVSNWIVGDKMYLYSFNADLDTKDLDFAKSIDLNTVKTISTKNYANFIELLEKEQLRPIDQMISSVTSLSAAEEAGLKRGDVILSLNGKKVYNFLSLRDSLQKVKNPVVSIELWREGKLLIKELTPKLTKIQDKEMKLIGVRSSGLYMGMNYIETESRGLVDSLYLGFPRTIDAISKTLIGFKKLIFAEVSMKSIGGPLAIGKVASDSFHTSMSYFFQLMALISVNLGVINLFPIPVLDGGHILFIVLETINGGPVSRKKMEIAQQFGLSLLLVLMVGAIFNDFSRFF
jgi:regulator of sigma E protease